MNRTRAERRHHTERLNTKRKDYVTVRNNIRQGKNLQHPAVCSCFMCGNPRRVLKGAERMTLQEQRTSDYRQEVNEYFIGKALEYAERIAMIDAVRAKILGQKHRWVDDLQRFVELSTQFPCSSDPATKTELVKAYAAIHGMEFEEVEYDEIPDEYDDYYHNSDNYDAYDAHYDSWVIEGDE